MALREVPPLLCRGHREALPAEFPEYAPDRKEPGVISITPGGHLGDVLAEPIDQATLRIPLFMWFGIDKVELSASAIAAPGATVIQVGKCCHIGAQLPCLWREDAAVIHAEKEPE